MRVNSFGLHLAREGKLAIGLAIVMAALLLCVELFGREGSTVTRLATVLNAGLPLVLLAIGASLVLACGELDLSVAGLCSFFGMSLLFVASTGTPKFASYAIVFGIAVSVGALQATAVVMTRIPSLVLTLGTSFLGFGVAFVLHARLMNTSQLCAATPGCKVGTVLPTYLPVSHRVGLFQDAVPWVVVVAAGVWLWRSGTLTGLRHLAVGMDAGAALRVALPVNRYRFGALLASTVLCYLYTMLMMVGFMGGGWNPGIGRGKELDAIATAIIGGTTVSGGWFSPLGLLLAAMLWAVFQKVQVWIPAVPPDAQQVVIGGLITAVGAFSSRWRHTKRGDAK